MSYPDHLSEVVQRLRCVMLENRAASDVMRYQDGLDIVHYVDPLYVHETRNTRVRSQAYRLVTTENQYRELAEVLSIVQGANVVIGYRGSLTDGFCERLQRIEATARAIEL